MIKSWIGIEVSCNPVIAEDLGIAVTEEFGSGVEMTPTGIRFYLQGDTFQDRWAKKLETILNKFTHAFQLTPSLTFSHFLLQNDNWADRWKEHFKPLRVGRDWLICPTWEQINPEPSDRVIWIDPGRAFGTGHHETTQLCLTWLEDWASERRRLNDCSLLDVGTGSGILAIGATLVGCRHVVAIDNDPEAMEVARENIVLNQLNHRIQLMEGIPSYVSHRFDIVLANIQARPLIQMADDLVQCLEERGKLVLSGILCEHKNSVQETYERKGFILLDERVLGEWCLLALSPQER